MSSEAFITEVITNDSDKPAERNPLLSQARIEHKKVLQVVEALGKKIDLMKDRQRQEYMQVEIIPICDLYTHDILIFLSIPGL